MKDELLKLKEKLKKMVVPEYGQKIKSHSVSKPIILDDKVDEFIKWYTDTVAITDHDKHVLPIQMRNFIEKMAVWYELRYPDYEINRIMDCMGQESKKVSDEMFNKNNYINQQLDLDNEIRVLDWDKFYNTKAFINSLPDYEKHYFDRPKYKSLVGWNNGTSYARLYLSNKGTVEWSRYMNTVVPGIFNEDFEGRNIKQVVEMIKDKGVEIPEDSDILKAIKNYDNETYQKEEMLNCVMYRIIERGGVRVGPRRAFLFAKEFNRNIDIPMIYGVDRTDPGLRSFINEYLKAGGSKDLICYLGYGLVYDKDEELETITISELIKTQANDAATFYTEEEDDLHQRFASALVSKVNQDIVSEEPKKLSLKK